MSVRVDTKLNVRARYKYEGEKCVCGWELSVRVRYECEGKTQV